jgi:hypothetical protein
MFHFTYQIVNDEDIAKQMGLDTSEESVGDIYLLRKESPFTRGLKANIKLNDYDFVSEKILTSKQMVDEPKSCSSKIQHYGLNAPFMVNNE